MSSSAVMADAATAAISAMHLCDTDTKSDDGPPSTKTDRHHAISVMHLSDTKSDDDGVPSTKSHNPLLICDAGYGFPSQRRPRKERINAVSRQICNFFEWRSREAKTKRGCSVSFLGSADDVEAVESRVGAHDGNCNDAIEYLSDTDICKYIADIGYEDGDAVYLSPDAEETLSSSMPPPRVVVVGMLIDRKITENRSKRRAALLNMRSVKLPLDDLNVKQLASDEPLNVDTVMELMQRWWWGRGPIQTEDIDTDLTREQCRKSFIVSAALSINTQRTRHPNRTFHKQAN